MAITNGKKISAFTLAELMIIMAVMTVILAAVAPVFTSRYNNISLDRVWSIIGASNNDDIYADAPSRAMTQQVFIGITPNNLEDIKYTYSPNSKLVIRSSDKIDGSKLQKQIEFYYGNNSYGYLFAGNRNLLLGGKYDNIRNNAYFNTGIGSNALNSIQSGVNNTAFGYNSLTSLTSGSENTAVGVSSGQRLTTGSGNVFIGYNNSTSNTTTPSDNKYNTIIGNKSEGDKSLNYSVVVGNNVISGGQYNVALGNNSFAGGNYNTAIGYGALVPATSTDYTNYNYNTAIGVNSCSKISNSADRITCIGGVGLDASMNEAAKSIMNGANKQSVLIGGTVNKYKSAATLEVHSITGNNSQYPYPGNSGTKLNDSSVIVNGNLIVRGQTYMIGRSPFPTALNTGATENTISLMGYKLYKESVLTHKPLIGFDGSEYNKRLFDDSNKVHQLYNGREHCICSYSCNASSNTGRDSYDWSFLKAYQHYLNVYNIGENYSFWQAPHTCGDTYNTTSNSAKSIELNNARNTTNYASLSPNTSADFFYPGYSCCPILSNYDRQSFEKVVSDSRLKNIESPFTSGIEKLSKLKIYNYTFKSDPSKLSHVGVIAQGLKRIFPDAVSKDSNGYYKIRTDEMFYAAINAIKELNANITTLNNKINSYISKVNKLQRENKLLKDKLLRLSKELDDLEK